MLLHAVRRSRRTLVATVAVATLTTSFTGTPAYAVTTTDIVNTAVAEIGTLEGSSRANSYGPAAGYSSSTSTSSYNWCAVFVSWVMQQTGATTYRSASVGDWLNAGRQLRSGLSITSTPRAGDIVAFDWDGNGDYASGNRHIGIVRAVTNSTTFTTVEGNTSGSPSDGVWGKTRYTNSSYNVTFIRVDVDNPTNEPAPSPVNTDPDADIDTGDNGVVRTTNGLLYWYRSVWDGITHGSVVQYGNAGDIPVTGDWDGDGDTDNGVVRETNGLLYWYRSVWDGMTHGSVVQYGVAGDIPVTGDWDGDGDTDNGVVRPSNGLLKWYRSVFDGITHGSIITYGNVGDQPVTVDWNKDGKSDNVVVRTNSGGTLDWYRSVFDGITHNGVLTYGSSGDTAVTGDWNNI
jgi:hypothetical protein